MESRNHPDYEAVRHVLTAPQIAARTAAYIGADDFDFGGLAIEADTMSGGERLLLAIADELWHAEKRAGLWEIAHRLDATNFERVLDALRISRGAFIVAVPARIAA